MSPVILFVDVSLAPKPVGLLSRLMRVHVSKITAVWQSTRRGVCSSATFAAIILAITRRVWDVEFSCVHLAFIAPIKLDKAPTMTTMIVWIGFVAACRRFFRWFLLLLFPLSIYVFSCDILRQKRKKRKCELIVKEPIQYSWEYNTGRNSQFGTESTARYLFKLHRCGCVYSWTLLSLQRWSSIFENMIQNSEIVFPFQK